MYCFVSNSLLNTLFLCFIHILASYHNIFKSFLFNIYFIFIYVFFNVYVSHLFIFSTVSGHLGLFWIMLLWTFVYKSLCEYVSCLLEDSRSEIAGSSSFLNVHQEMNK